MGGFLPRWAPADDELLRKLAADGLSASLIGEQIGKSRNAVIARAGRISVVLVPKHAGSDGAKPRAGRLKRGKKLEPEGRRANGTLKLTRPNRQMMGRRRHREPDPNAKPPKPYIERASDIGTKTLLELKSGECHWPCGDPKQPGFLFCGAPVLDEAGNLDTTREPLYCNHHRWRASPHAAV